MAEQELSQSNNSEAQVKIDKYLTEQTNVWKRKRETWITTEIVLGNLESRQISSHGRGRREPCEAKGTLRNPKNNQHTLTQTLDGKPPETIKTGYRKKIENP